LLIPKVLFWNNTHTRLTALLYGTTQLSQCQKGKTALDLTEARDYGVAVASMGPLARLHLAPHEQPCQIPITLCFYGADALPAAQPTASKH